MIGFLITIHAIISVLLITVVLMQASQGKPEVVRVLLAAGADKDLRNKKGKTALDWAIERKKDACAALLR